MNPKKDTIFVSLKLVVVLYKSRGFVIKVINADNPFECLREMLLALGITLNVCAANEHIPLIERCIRTFKERVRAIRHSLPYKNMPGLMIVHLVYFVCHWLNAFPPKGQLLPPSSLAEEELTTRSTVS